jgi:hypothetical protein
MSEADSWGVDVARKPAWLGHVRPPTPDKGDARRDGGKHHGSTRGSKRSAPHLTSGLEDGVPETNVAKKKQKLTTYQGTTAKSKGNSAQASLSMTKAPPAHTKLAASKAPPPTHNVAARAWLSSSAGNTQVALEYSSVRSSFTLLTTITYLFV